MAGHGASDEVVKTTTAEEEEGHHGPSSAVEIAKAAKAAATKREFYDQLTKEISSLISGERDYVANSANVASLVYHQLNARSVDQVNWVGFYFFKPKQNKQLVLGPFHGLPACIRIPWGKGVCGKAAIDRETQLIEDVHSFPGHIACDSASNSELVVPLVLDDRLLGVFDIDSPLVSGLDKDDKLGLERIADLLVKGCDWPLDW